VACLANNLAQGSPNPLFVVNDEYAGRGRIRCSLFRGFSEVTWFSVGAIFSLVDHAFLLFENF
jgi:hypothetical protein